MHKYQSIQQIYGQVMSLQSFAPSKFVNHLFTQLVKIAVDSRSRDTLSSSQKKNLQLACSQAEFELERFWAKRIVNSKTPLQMLKRFPYLENYRKLTQMEWVGLQSCTVHTGHNVLFLGGGPLPLTAIILAQEYNIKVTVLDVSEDAVNLSSRLIKKLNLDDKVQVIHMSGQRFERYHEYDVIFLAALAGVHDSEKQAIFSQIHHSAAPETHILARSSYGKRQYLYRPLNLDAYKNLSPIIEIRPYHDVVNSVVIFKQTGNVKH